MKDSDLLWAKQKLHDLLLDITAAIVLHHYFPPPQPTPKAPKQPRGQ